jgi:hypothetical protein
MITHRTSRLKPHLARRLAPLAALALLAPVAGEAQYFTPGSGGNIPNIPPFVGNPGEFPGFRVDVTHRRNNVFFGGDRAEIGLLFPPPSHIEATGYRLQRRLSPSLAWEDHPWEIGYLETVSSDQNNFYFTPEGSYHYRLLALGGPRAGEVSNEVFAPFATVETRFAGWFLDESMFLTGVMFPWVGRGLEASFTVRKLEDDSDVEGGISLQWYRVNPATFELIPIQGATNPLYVTTQADVGGYHLLVRATGDGVKVGGFQQVVSFGGVLIPNRSYATHFSATGFRLILHRGVPSLAPEDLTLSYWDDDLMTTVEIPIDSVTPVGSNAVFRIDAAMPAGPAAFNLMNQSEVWRLAQMMGGGHMMMEGLTIDPTERTAPAISVRIRGGRQLASGRGSVDFRTVALRRTSSPTVIQVQNRGNAPLGPLGTSIRGGSQRDFLVTAAVPRTLQASQQASFQIRFRPRQRGLRRSQVRIAHNAPGAKPFVIPVVGRGR